MRAMKAIGVVKAWAPAELDLGLAAGTVLALPLGGLVKWRRGATGYGNPMPPRPPLAFYLNVGVIEVGLISAWMS